MISKLSILRSLINSAFFNLSKCRYRNVPEICASTNDEHIPAIHFNDKFVELAESDEDKDKIGEIIREYNVAKNRRRQVPSDLSIEAMAELMILPTKSQRRNYLRFLFKKEILKSAKVRKKELRQETRKNRSQVDDGHIKYGLGYNTLLMHVNRSDMKKFYERRMRLRMEFNQKIVLDLSYDEFMVKKESQNCASQLGVIGSVNRMHADPFNIYICNADRTKHTVQYLEKQLPNIWKDDSAFTCSSSSYLDIFPKEKLVYLSPHADEVLRCYDHEAVYIIGGFVDKRNKCPASYEKAKREGIQSYSLPLDDYIEWKSGTKSLTLDQVVNILLEMKVSNDWKKAFRFLPERKVTDRSFEETG